MNAMTTLTDDQVLDALRSRGIDKRLAEEEQTRREAERSGILVTLEKLIPEDEANGKRLAALCDETRQAIRLAEAAAAEGRLRLNTLEAEWGQVGARAERLRGALRKLADPGIEAARVRLRSFHDQVRSAFRSRTLTVQVDDVSGRKGEKVESNGDEIKRVIDAIRAADGKLEALQLAPRPANLSGVIASIVDPVLLRVQRLAGLAPTER